MRKKDNIKYLYGIIFLMSLVGCTPLVGVLNPKGIVAFEERKLLFDTLAIMLIVVIPVIIMSITFVYHYQQSHRIRDYKPDWAHSFLLESIWWGIPCVIIVILGVVTWKSTHDLDPYRPLTGDKNPPIVIQAISLPWKWLFIYPEEHIATLNYVRIPVGRQIEFWLTADNAAMTAFFIPQLGSQLYAMAGMRTRLHLLATEVGSYDGMNALYDGGGFSDMHFTAHVVYDADMKPWMDHIKQTAPDLNEETYLNLLKPSENNAPTFYRNVSSDLFDSVIQVYASSYGKNHPRVGQADWYKES